MKAKFVLGYFLVGTVVAMRIIPLITEHMPEYLRNERGLRVFNILYAGFIIACTWPLYAVGFIISKRHEKTSDKVVNIAHQA